MALVINPTQNIGSIAKDIASEFLSRAADLKLDATEKALLDRASTRLAASAVLAPGAAPEVQARLAMDRDASIAVFANLVAAKAVNAEQILRKTAFDILVKGIHLALGIALAA